jgi:hypothetical protein
MGFSPGSGAKRTDLKVSADGADRPHFANRVMLDVFRDDIRSDTGRPFRASPQKNPYPGLKPWAILFRRFAASDSNHQSPFTSHLSPGYVVPTFI